MNQFSVTHLEDSDDERYEQFDPCAYVSDATHEDYSPSDASDWSSQDSDDFSLSSEDSIPSGLW